MRRRTLITVLAGTAGALAGCVQGNGSDENDNGDGSDENDNGDGSDENDNGEDRVDGVGKTPGWADTGGTTVVDQFDSNPSRPECHHVEPRTVTDADGREHETAGTTPYPEAASFDDAPSFLAAFERTYVSHDILCAGGTVLSIMNTVHDRERLDRHDGVSTVFLLRHAIMSSSMSRDGRLAVIEPGPPGGVVYAVDGTGLARAEVEEIDIGVDDWDLAAVDVEAVAPDPLEAGTLVATFD